MSDKVRETLESIASQTYDNLELVIIDEQPDINTEDFISKWAEPYKIMVNLKI